MKKKSLNSIIVFGYSIALSCICYFLWITYQNLRDTSQDSHEFIYSLALQQATENVFSDIRDIETGARGFVITGDEDYLKPYLSGKSRITNDLEDLKKTFRNGIQTNDARLLYFLINERLEHSDKQVTSRRTKGIEEVINQVHTGRGIQIMDSIRTVVGRLEGGCVGRLNQINADKKLMAKNTVHLFFISGGLVILFLSFSCLLLLRAFRRKSIYEKQVEYLSGIANHVNDAILYTDIGLLITDWNEGAVRMFGYSSDEAIGKSSAVILKSNFVSENRLLITNEILMQGYWKGEIFYHRKNGEPVTGFVTATAVEHHGEIAGFIFLISDISEMKSMEQKFVAALESATEAMIMINENGIIETANTNSEDLLGYSSEELEGEKIEEIFPGIRLRIKKHFQQLRQNNLEVHSAQLKTESRTRNGSTFSAELSLTYFNTVKGAVLFIKLQSAPDKLLTQFKSLLNPQ